MEPSAQVYLVTDEPGPHYSIFDFEWRYLGRNKDLAIDDPGIPEIPPKLALRTDQELSAAKVAAILALFDAILIEDFTSVEDFESRGFGIYALGEAGILLDPESLVPVGDAQTLGDDEINLAAFPRNGLLDALKGDDIVLGSTSADTVHGSGGSDVLSGRGGSDVLNGGSGRDILRGGVGADEIEGGRGKDRLFGGNGSDNLEGGKGNDLLAGNKGADTFIFGKRFGDDTILDFDASSRREDIDLSDVSQIRNWRDLKNNHMEASGDDVVISQGKNSITLLDVSLGDLDRSDFVF